jgi:hypothetical protein
MMEAVSTYETSVNFYQTTPPNIPEDRHLQNVCMFRYQLHYSRGLLDYNRAYTSLKVAILYTEKYLFTADVVNVRIGQDRLHYVPIQQIQS